MVDFAGHNTEEIHDWSASSLTKLISYSLYDEIVSFNQFVSVHILLQSTGPSLPFFNFLTKLQTNIIGIGNRPYAS